MSVPALARLRTSLVWLYLVANALLVAAIYHGPDFTGVEEDVQRHILDELGCEYLQGYLFGRPVGPIEASREFQRLRRGGSVALARR